jgi:hypothetical protein
MTDLHSRFDNDNIDTYFANLVSKDVAKEYSAQCAKWLAEQPIVQELGYDPFISLSSQPDCYFKYFNLLEKYGVSKEAEEYLPTRSWFMRGTISAPLLLKVALVGKGEYVDVRAGDFPEDLYYIIHS